jgi:hypothetical protein
MPTGHPLELVAEFEERPSVNPTTHGTKGNTSMAKFLFVYRSDKDTFDTMAPEVGGVYGFVQISAFSCG